MVRVFVDVNAMVNGQAKPVTPAHLKKMPACMAASIEPLVLAAIAKHHGLVRYVRLAVCLLLQRVL
tara:strand:+ start:254 stop:451 length:198 start_codon:yes stop_codon:yes gene_type:complete